MAFYVPPKTPTNNFGRTTPYTTSPTVYPSTSPYSYFDPTAPIPTPTTYPYTPPSILMPETTNLPAPLPTPTYNSGTYVPSLSDTGPIPAPSYSAPSAPAAASAPPALAEPVSEAPTDLPAIASVAGPEFAFDAGSTSGGLPADLGGSPFGVPGLGPSTPSGQSPGLAALQGLIGRSGGSVQSPGLQSLLEGTAGRLGGQARQRYGRQFQTFLANQRMTQRQRADAAGMDAEAVSPLQEQMQIQAALDRLRAALDMPSRTPVSRRAPQFAPSSTSGGGLSSSTSPYLY